MASRLNFVGDGRRHPSETESVERVGYSQSPARNNIACVKSILDSQHLDLVSRTIGSDDTFSGVENEHKTCPGRKPVQDLLLDICMTVVGGLTSRRRAQTPTGHDGCERTSRCGKRIAERHSTKPLGS